MSTPPTNPTTTPTTLENLPTPILQQIFRHLDIFEIFSCVSVCKIWLEMGQKVLKEVDCDVKFGTLTDPMLDFPSTISLPFGFISEIFTLFNLKYRKEEKKIFNRWTDLFHGNKHVPLGIGQAIVINEDPDIPEVIDLDKEPIEEVMKRLNLSPKSISLVPRGLNNNDNKCFMNTVLQSILGCNLFCSFLEELKKARVPKQDYPYLEKIIRFFNEFKILDTKQQQQQDSSRSWSRQGTPFTPSYFYDTLLEFNPMAGSTWQEDAQEYLCFLLHKLHDEVIRASPKKADSSNENENEWRGVVGSGKSAIFLTKTDEFASSPLTDIFGGTFQSIVSKRGLAASARVEPFFCLPLDIQQENINSVAAAVDALTSKEKVDYQNKGTDIPATKQLKIEKQPMVLLIHLKRFAYDRHTFVPHKIRKFLSYPLILQLQPQWLTSKTKPSRYQLFSVISHLGVQTVGGHYTCDIYHDATQRWLHYDDSRVSPIEDPESVLKSNNAYLLFYKKIS